MSAILLLLTVSAALAQSAKPDSVVYRLLPSSRFEARTGKTGFFSFVGHEHLIRARSPSGRIVLHPDTVHSSTVTIVIPIDSLEVMTPPETAEVRKVTKAMREDVLHADIYREITFVSTAVTPIEGGFRVRGQLTLVGQSHEVSVDLTGVSGRDTLRLEGRFPINQTEYGIKPYRGGPAGVVRVADRVELRLVALAVRGN